MLDKTTTISTKKKRTRLSYIQQQIKSFDRGVLKQSFTFLHSYNGFLKLCVCCRILRPPNSSFYAFISLFVTTSASEDQHNALTLSITLVTPKDEDRAIRKLKPKKSLGPDKIPAYVSKGLRGFLVFPLCHIYNLSNQGGF